MTMIVHNQNGLSSRENRVLEIFQSFESRNLSSEVLRLLTGYDRKALHVTLKKLMDSGYLEVATVSRVYVYRLRRNEI
ncbi:MAG: hypothetical protein R6U44_10680 [Archaeoglobaceae archaeon]